MQPQPQPHQQPRSDIHPLVIFLDLDGTVIGDISHAVVEREMVKTFCKDAPAKVRAMRNSHIMRLRYGIIRPKFDAFVRRIESHNRDAVARGGRKIELFVYTASEDAWAGYIIPCIETAVGFRFNRPIFSRRHCEAGSDGSFFKSLGPLLPTVAAALRRKGHARLKPADLEGRVALVDNNPTVLRTEIDRARLVSCPTYGFAAVFDVLGQLDVTVLQENYVRIAKALATFGMYPADEDQPRSSRHFMRAYHSALVTQLRKTTRPENGRELCDRFWIRLRSALIGTKPVSDFRAGSVRLVNRQVAQTQGANACGSQGAR